MNENMFFMHRIKRTNGTFDKGIEVKDSYAAAKQSYHAYLGAYAYGQDKDKAGNIITDFVSCHITDMSGMALMAETWRKLADPEPEPEN